MRFKWIVEYHAEDLADATRIKRAATAMVGDETVVYSESLEPVDDGEDGDGEAQPT